MIKNEKELIQNNLKKISDGLWSSRCLANVLYEIMHNGANIQDCHISTLHNILCESIQNMYEEFETFKQNFKFN